MAAVAVVVVGIAVVAGRQPATPGFGEARLEVDGEGRVTRADGRVELVRGSTIVRPGDTVEAISGTFSMVLATGATLEGRSARTDETAATEVLMGATPELVAGDLLAVTDDALTLDVGGNRVDLGTGDGGAARLNRSLAVAVATYQGSVTVDSAGQERSVPALREMAIAVLGRPPTGPRPLDYDDADPWDLRFLGDAIELGRRLDALSRATTVSLGPSRAISAEFLRSVLPALADEPDFTPDLLNAARDPGDTLVGAAIAVLGRRGPFSQRWQQVFGFRDETARWGLVALDQGVSGDPLVQGIEAALNADQFALAPTETLANGPAEPVPSPPSEGPESASPPSPPGRGDVGQTTTTSPPPPAPPPTTAPILPPLPPITLPPNGSGELLPDTGIGVLDELVDPLDKLLGGLLNGGRP